MIDEATAFNNPTTPAPGSRTFMCTPDSAQEVYNHLFVKKPKHFTVYREDQRGEDIFITFPIVVPRQTIFVEIRGVRRIEGENELHAIVLPLKDQELSNMLVPYNKALPYIILGQLTGYGIAEAEYLMRMRRNLPQVVIEANACEDPRFKDFL